ncbi:hypothetical protein KUTeg_020517 [Tegillarca granosa]|uniref:CCHC NOA-type domain-containing protein n=1 Tax=Tegillarca granosa TaxID=220873 RepID=A0ABQ9EDK8_TEGGR|nr:hypothetical protein KUTeg_020517 [Tegillarca granosa]
MSNIPVTSVSPVSRPSSGRPSPSSSIYNGGSFEVITGSSSTSPRAPLDFSYLNPFNNGQPGSMTDVTLEEALERVQDLMKENHELREYLKENNEMMKQQYKSLMEWKEKINQTNEFNSKKFEETRKLVESLQNENSEMKKMLEEAKSADEQSKKLKELEQRNKDLEKNVSDKNDVIENLQEEMLMIEKGNEQMGVGESLANTIKINQLESQVRQFRESNDQLLQDLENAQKLKEQFQKENASLCDQNIELSKKLEKSVAYTSDLQSLRSQVVSLLNEVTESQNKLEAASKTIEKKNNRIIQLEQEMNRMQEQMIQNQDDLTVIETLKLSINNYQEAINAERREHQTTKCKEKESKQQRQGVNQHEESEYQPLSCPKCDLQCPDVDTLQIHVLECIDQPDNIN